MSEKRDISTIDNLEIHNKDNFVLISVNPRFYNLDVVYSAIYMFLDECYVKVDGEPEEEILVELKPKKKIDLETIGRQFNNELINYAVVGIRGVKTADIRRAIVERALKSHQPNDDKINIPWKSGEAEKNE